jgi:4-nitrophenyl phosphatase
LFELSRIEALVLDIDGVLYEGDRALPGAVELIAELNESSFPYVLLSNNTTRPAARHVAKLLDMGMPVPPSSILTGARVVAQILGGESHSGARCLVIGELGLLEALEQAGFEITQTDHRNVDYVVIGMDRQLTYEKLKTATLAIRNGAHFVSSNVDPIFPDGNDLIPASGTIQAALETATGVKARVTGKPEPLGFQVAMTKLGSRPETTGMVGDQLEVDILGAQRAGLKTFLILSSITPQFCKGRTKISPDDVYESTLAFYQEWVKR